MNILDKPIVLKLNKAWQPIGQCSVKQAICDLMGGTHGDRPAFAMDVCYALDELGDYDFAKPLGCTPVAWDEWMNLTVRSCDLSISTPKQRFRAPTVMIAANYTGMPMWRPGLSRRSIFERDAGVCQYTGRTVDWANGNLDHVVPRSRGGPNSFENLVWSDRVVNSRKANRRPEEAGLTLLRQPVRPESIPVFRRIQNTKHRDWKWFLKS